MTDFKEFIRRGVAAQKAVDEIMAKENITSTPNVEDRVNISLTRDEFEALLIMCGYATAAAMKQDTKMGYAFLALVNTINRDNPKWIPYEIPQ